MYVSKYLFIKYFYYYCYWGKNSILAIASNILFVFPSQGNPLAKTQRSLLLIVLRLISNLRHLKRWLNVSRSDVLCHVLKRLSLCHIKKWCFVSCAEVKVVAPLFAVHSISWSDKSRGRSCYAFTRCVQKKGFLWVSRTKQLLLVGQWTGDKLISSSFRIFMLLWAHFNAFMCLILLICKLYNLMYSSIVFLVSFSFSHICVVLYLAPKCCSCCTGALAAARWRTVQLRLIRNVTLMDR